MNNEDFLGNDNEENYLINDNEENNNYYEHGAHFRYQDLYDILKRMQRNQNSKQVISQQSSDYQVKSRNINLNNYIKSLNIYYPNKIQSNKTSVPQKPKEKRNNNHFPQYNLNFNKVLNEHKSKIKEKKVAKSTSHPKRKIPATINLGATTKKLAEKAKKESKSQNYIKKGNNILLIDKKPKSSSNSKNKVMKLKYAKITLDNKNSNTIATVNCVRSLIHKRHNLMTTIKRITKSNSKNKSSSRNQSINKKSRNLNEYEVKYKHSKTLTEKNAKNDKSNVKNMVNKEIEKGKKSLLINGKNFNINCHSGLILTNKRKEKSKEKKSSASKSSKKKTNYNLQYSSKTKLSTEANGLGFQNTPNITMSLDIPTKSLENESSRNRFASIKNQILTLPINRIKKKIEKLYSHTNNSNASINIKNYYLSKTKKNNSKSKSQNITNTTTQNKSSISCTGLTMNKKIIWPQYKQNWKLMNLIQKDVKSKLATLSKYSFKGKNSK